MKHETKKITTDEIGIRLDRWCQRHYPHITFVVLQKALRKGDVRVDGNKVTPAYRLQAEEQVTLYRPLTVPLETTQKSELVRLSTGVLDQFRACVIAQEDTFWVFNKPAGLATQGGTKITRHFLDYFAQAFPGETPYLVHRLDKETSGILLVAKTPKQADYFANLFRERLIYKEYLAIVQGVPTPKEGVISSPLETENGVQQALTRYRVVESLNRKASLASLFPETGRKHQLRRHMASLGYPILGDDKYGDGESLEILGKGLCLHAHRISWKEQGRIRTYTAPLPRTLLTFLQICGRQDFG